MLYVSLQHLYVRTCIGMYRVTALFWCVKINQPLWSWHSRSFTSISTIGQERTREVTAKKSKHALWCILARWRFSLFRVNLTRNASYWLAGRIRACTLVRKSWALMKLAGKGHILWRCLAGYLSTYAELLPSSENAHVLLCGLSARKHLFWYAESLWFDVR